MSATTSLVERIDAEFAAADEREKQLMTQRSRNSRSPAATGEA